MLARSSAFLFFLTAVFAVLIVWGPTASAVTQDEYYQLREDLKPLYHFQVKLSDITHPDPDALCREQVYEQTYQQIAAFQHFLVYLNDEIIHLQHIHSIDQQRGYWVSQIDKIFTQRMRLADHHFKDLQEDIADYDWLNSELRKLRDRLHFIDQKMDDHDTLDQMQVTIHYERDAWADYKKDFPLRSATCQEYSAADRLQHYRDEFITVYHQVRQDYAAFINHQRHYHDVTELEAAYQRMTDHLHDLETEYNDFYNNYAYRLHTEETKVTREMRSDFHDMDDAIDEMYYDLRNTARHYYYDNR